MHTLRIMHPMHGDRTRTWNPADEMSTAEVKALFDTLVGRNMRAYDTSVPDAGEEITEFRPQASEIIITGPLAGG